MTSLASAQSRIKPTPEFPWEWFYRCNALGRWPRQIAAALTQVNGPRWAWRFQGHLIDLWKHLSEKCPGFCGRDTFIAGWRLLESHGLVAFGQAGWRAVVRVSRTTKSGPENYDPDPRFQDREQVPVSGPAIEGTRAPAVVVDLVDLEPTTLVLPPAPLARSTMTKSANDNPTDSPFRTRDPRRYTQQAREARERATQGQPTPPPSAPTEAGVVAQRGAAPRRLGGLTPDDLRRLHGLPTPETTATPEAPPQSPTPTPRASTEAAFWGERYPKLCDLAERLWGARGRANVELRAGSHAELLSWSVRATDSVWADALGALSEAKAEPGAIAKYLVGIMRRTVPVSEKARRGDVTVPVAPLPRAQEASTPPPAPKPFKRRTIADFLRDRLAQEINPCNLSGAAPAAPTTHGEHQGAQGDHDHGSDRIGSQLLGDGERRAG